jgi:hypothetical protein
VEHAKESVVGSLPDHTPEQPYQHGATLSSPGDTISTSTHR